jgi:hypothetical protein
VDETALKAYAYKMWLEYPGPNEDAALALYRAGQAAERARCIAIAECQVYETPEGCRTVAYIRAHYDGVHAVVDALKKVTK